MKLDEQSFQSLLAAAFTIQEYNDRSFGGVAPLAKKDEPLDFAPSFPIECLADCDTEERVENAISEEIEPKTGELRIVEEPTELEFDPQISDHLLQQIVQDALQATRATSAAIALKQRKQLTCLEAVGEAASEIRAMIDSKAGFTGVCASTCTLQFCTNTALDPRAEADSYRKIGIRAVMVMPLLYRDHVLGSISVFSRTPYAFGESGLQALQTLAQKFTANLPHQANTPTGLTAP